MAWCQAVRIATYMPVAVSGGGIGAYSSIIPATGLVGSGGPIWGVWRARRVRGPWLTGCIQERIHG